MHGHLQLYADDAIVIYSANSIQQTKNKIIPPISTLFVKNEIIHRVTEAKYLGLIIDEKLNWNNHVNFVKSKIIPIVSMLRRTQKKDIPNELRLSVYLYYSYIHSLSFIVCITCLGLYCND